MRYPRFLSILSFLQIHYHSRHFSCQTLKQEDRIVACIIEPRTFVSYSSPSGISAVYNLHASYIDIQSL